MVKQQLFPNFRVANGDGIEKPFQEYLGDFNILAIRRVPEPSHGPATELLRRLIAENRGVEDVSVRGFDIRSPDRPCEKCQGPHIVFSEPNLATICDGDGSILRQFGVVGYDRFFVVRSGPQIIDVGPIEEISLWGMRLGWGAATPRDPLARAPPHRQQADRRDTAA